MSTHSTLHLSHFKKIELIGSGSFGEVYKVKNKKTGEISAAKISFRALTEDSKEILRDLKREITIMSKINHPCILHYVGFSPTNFHKEQKPVIVTEFLSNGTLNDIIDLERKGLAKDTWNDTRKLVCIYGISAAMAYLHAHDIIHRDLKPANILMDDFLCPKIADFGLSKIKQNGESNASQSTLAVKGTPIYIAPEIWSDMEYTTAVDVYSFAFIVFEIMTSDEPYQKLNCIQIQNNVLAGIRPEIKGTFPEPYFNLITSCWDQDPHNRPTFDQILEKLRTDKGFITDLVEENDYLDYIDFIDNYPTTFTDQRIQIDQYLKRTSDTFKKISIRPDTESTSKITETESKSQTKHRSKSKDSESSKKSSTHKKKKVKTLLPSSDFSKLDEEGQSLVIEANDDIDAQCTVGQYLIDGSNGFPQNTEIGILYLEQSTNGGSLEATIFYSRMLIEGQIIPEDIPKAKKMLRKYLKENNGKVNLLYGKVKKKEGEFKKAKSYFEKASKVGNSEAMYELGKLLFKGQGCEKSMKDAKKWFDMSLKNGFTKCNQFLSKHSDEINEKKEPEKKEPNSTNPYKIAADKGDVNSMLSYATICEKGNGVEVNLSETAKYYKMAGDHGHEVGMFNYAVMLIQGKGVAVDMKEAAKYLKMSADKGLINGMINYAQMRFKGDEIEQDKEEAAKYFKMAADKGDVKCMFQIANMLFKGDGIEMNKKEAAKYYKMAADKGDESCRISIANMLFKGDGIDMNKEEACKYYKILADNGNVSCASYLANILYNGNGVPENKSEAAKYFKLAADLGDVDSMYTFAIMAERGVGIEENCYLEAEYLKKGVEKGHVKSMLRLAFLLRYGYGNVLSDDAEATRLYKLAADKGSVEGLSSYAIALDCGYGVKMDKVEAARLFKIAADKGDIYSMKKYAELCINYFGSIIPRDVVAAAKYYKMAADNGEVNEMVQYGLMARYGNGVEENKSEALRYFKMAIDESGHSSAYLNYGEMIYNGEGIEMNKSEGLEYIKLAAEHRNREAMYKYGEMLRVGTDDVKMDKAKAAEYFEVIAEDGFPGVCAHYAEMLMKGDGVPMDKEKAISILRNDYDDPDSLFMLANILLEGDGIPADREGALRYFKSAADKGHESAKETYEKLMNSK